MNKYRTKHKTSEREKVDNLKLQQQQQQQKTHSPRHSCFTSRFMQLKSLRQPAMMWQVLTNKFPAPIFPDWQKYFVLFQQWLADINLRGNFAFVRRLLMALFVAKSFQSKSSVLWTSGHTNFHLWKVRLVLDHRFPAAIERITPSHIHTPGERHNEGDCNWNWNWNCWCVKLNSFFLVYHLLQRTFVVRFIF